MTNERRLADFEGEWRISRIIAPVQGPEAEFEGIAVWTVAPGGMSYREAGLMTVADHPPMQAERQYFWANDLSVFFDDGRFFHKVPSGGGQARHWCAPDDYLITYEFEHWPRFIVQWQVKGPRKDYRATTKYQRC
ncbi:MAG: DUF6314 family protein [Roseobacter sp.]